MFVSVSHYPCVRPNLKYNSTSQCRTKAVKNCIFSPIFLKILRPFLTRRYWVAFWLCKNCKPIKVNVQSVVSPRIIAPFHAGDGLLSQNILRLLWIGENNFFIWTAFTCFTVEIEIDLFRCFKSKLQHRVQESLPGLAVVSEYIFFCRTIVFIMPWCLKTPA